MEDIGDFVETFSGFSEPCFFYDGEVEILYDKENHIYNLVKDGEWSIALLNVILSVIADFVALKTLK